MKIHRFLVYLAITLISVLCCSCQSSEERLMGSEMIGNEIDRTKTSMDNTNELLKSLVRAGSADGGISSDTYGSGAPMGFETAENTAERLAYSRMNNDIKRGSWSKMNAAWGKRASNGVRNTGWTKFSGSWGKREPGWNNLKGLWGKRAEKWNKLSSAWGKRQEINRIY